MCRDELRRVRHAGLAFAACVALALPAPRAAAEADLGPAKATGEVEVGGRAITGENWDDSRFQNYKSTEPGVFGRASGLVEDDEERYFIEFNAQDIAEDDQSYSVRMGRYNRFRIEAEFEEFWHVYGGGETLTLHEPGGKGVLLLPDATQIPSIVTGLNRQNALLAAYANAFSVPLRSQLKNARVGLFYRATPELEFDLGYRLSRTQGSRPFSMGFGSPGGTFVNIAAPIDQETHEVTAGIQYARESYTVRFDYTGSFFRNDIDLLIVDNPIARPPDTATASSQGRADLPPDNSAHTFMLNGTVQLPAPFPLALAATAAYSLRSQDDAFTQHTINSVLAPNPVLVLPADSLDGEVQTLLGSIRLNGRPAERLAASTFYRIYNHDNKTDPITFPGHAVNDQSVSVEERTAGWVDYTKHNAGVDLAYTVARPLTLRTGFEWERWDRNEHREASQTDEYIGKLGADVRAASWVLVRARARAGVRQGTGYNTFAHLAHTVEDPAGSIAQAQSPLLRKFDEANRKLYRGDLSTQLTPRDDVTVTLAGGYSLSDYDDSELGLRDASSWNAGTDLSYRPIEWLGLSAFYAFEHTRYDQRSRWRPVAGVFTAEDPVNDWSSVSSDYVHTVGVGSEVVLVPRRLDLTLSYVLEAARTKTRASSNPGSATVTATGVPVSPATPDGGNAPDWPGITDWFHTFTAALNYHVVENLTLRAQYDLELYNLTNFRTDSLEAIIPSSTINGSGGFGTTSDVFLTDRERDYQAHVFGLSMIYRF